MFLGQRLDRLLGLLLRVDQPFPIFVQALPGAELREQISFRLEGRRLGGRSRSSVTTVLQAFMLFQFALDQGLGIAAGPHQVLLGILDAVLQQLNLRLRDFQLLLNDRGIVLAGVGRQFGQPSDLSLFRLQPAFEIQNPAVDLRRLLVLGGRRFFGFLQSRSERHVHIAVSEVNRLQRQFLLRRSAGDGLQAGCRAERRLIDYRSRRRRNLGFASENPGSFGLPREQKGGERHQRQDGQREQQELAFACMHGNGPQPVP